MIKNKNKKYNHGFTLIETMIYIALFAFIITGALVSTYAILESNSRNQIKAMIQEEGSFLTGKIDWALNGKQNASVSILGTLLTASRSDGTSTVSIKIDSTNKKMQINESTGFKDLNNSNVEIVCPALGCFTHTLASGDGINPESIETIFTISARTPEGLFYSQDFSTIKYLRK